MKRILTTLLLIVASFAAMAQLQNPAHWSYSVTNVTDDEAVLVFNVKLESGWHLYSQYTDDNGPLAIAFEFNKGDNYRREGKVTEPKPHEEYDELFGCTVRSFSGNVAFRQKVKLLSDKPSKVTGVLSYQLCNDGSCIPPEDVDFSFSLPAAKKVAEAVAEEVEDTVAEVAESENQDTVKKAVAQATTEDAESDEESQSLFVIFILALLGGIITMFTPCVFPMIPMTVNFFMHSSTNKRKNRNEALFFGFSIVFLFAVLGAILALVFGPESLYFIGTHWIPNLIFFIIFLVFSMSFFGMFEIKMPEKWINKSDEQADKGGFLAPFFIALTTVLVSFSCTGPILGAALVGLTTSTTNRLVSLLTMLGFGIGFALPFTLLALFPGVLKNMKSGSWLNTVKVVFAFLELAFGLKFLQQADLYCGWGILDREVYLALWIVIFAMLGFYLLGKLRFKGDDPVERLGVGRIFLAILDLAFVVYMIPGMWGAPLKGISGFMPPMESQDFNLARHGSMAASAEGSTITVGKLPADRKYVNQLHTPDGYEAFYDLKEAKAYAKEHNMPIFIDFTGKTCANCREMEHYVWSDENVMALLSSKFIMCALYADENTIELPEEEWVVDERGKQLKTLGKCNLYYQKSMFNMNAQPYYVIIDAEGNVLTKENYKYDRDVNKFMDYLNEGLSNFSR